MATSRSHFVLRRDVMRKRSNLMKESDARFRVRIKFAPPPGGIRRLTEIHNWLSARFGAKGFAVLPVDWESGGAAAFAVHINDVSAADDVRQFVDDAINDPAGGDPLSLGYKLVR